MINLEEFAKKARAVPFLEFGRDYDGWDCWGIPIVGFRDILGIDLPSMSGQYSSTKRMKELESLIDANAPAQWHRVEKPRALDCAIVKIHGIACHVGLMIDKRNMIHVEQGCFTLIERVDRLPWAGAVEGFYRHATQP